MKRLFVGLFLLLTSINFCSAQAQSGAASSPTKEEQEVLDLSKAKWQWMSDKKVDTLDALFDAKANFVHMGGTWGKARELDIIKGGFIWYKQAYVYSASVNISGNTAILLNDIDLVAKVGQNDAINPFMVTEVYLKENGKWKLAQLTFSHLSRPLKIKNDNNAQPQKH